MRYKPHKKNLITPEALQEMSAKEIQEKFKVSQATAYRWLKMGFKVNKIIPAEEQTWISYKELKKHIEAERRKNNV